MSSFKNLENLGSSYFHEDYDLAHGSAEDVLRSYKTESNPTELRATRAEVDALLSTSLTEDEIDDWWEFAMGACYDPRDDGWTYRDWFAHVRDVLSSP